MARCSAIALLTAAMAYSASAIDIASISIQDCPPGWSYSAGNNNDPNTYCCPGSSHVEDGGGYCCLDSSFDVSGSDSSFSSSDISDIFSGDSDIFSDSDAFFTRVKRDVPEPSCAATVDYKDPDYSSKVSSLSKSLYATSTKASGNKPASNTATTTAATATSTGSSDDTASATGEDKAASSTTSSDNAAAMPTAEIVGGILAMAAAFAM